MTWRFSKRVRSSKVERLLKSKYAADFLEAIKLERSEGDKGNGRIIVKRIGSNSYLTGSHPHQHTEVIR